MKSFLKAAFIIWLRRKCVSTIPGRISAKPSTFLGHLHGVARVHEANDIEFATKGTVKRTVQYLCQEYELLHGFEALAPRRREGFSRSMLRKMLISLDGLHLRSRAFPEVSGKRR